MTTCDKCNEFTLPDCLDELNIDGLANNTSYAAKVTHPNGNVYFQNFLSDGSGVGTIDLNDFPAQLLNPYSGVYRLEVLDEDDVNETWTCEDVIYTCLALKVEPTTGGATSVTIPMC